jgi:hypothetical protein
LSVGGRVFLSGEVALTTDPLNPVASVNNFIAKHFAPVEDVGSWVVMRRNSGFAGGTVDR